MEIAIYRNKTFRRKHSMPWVIQSSMSKKAFCTQHTCDFFLLLISVMWSLTGLAVVDTLKSTLGDNPASTMCSYTMLEHSCTL